MARRLLENTSDVIGLLDTLRSLVSDGESPAQRKLEPQRDSGNEQPSEELAFLAQRSFYRPRRFFLKCMDGSVLAFLNCTDGSVLVFLKCMDGSALAYLRFPMQSAPTRFPQLGNSEVP